MVESHVGFLLDTNVISELMKPRSNPDVARWVDGTPEDLLYLSAITMGEVRKGIDLLDETEPRRAALQTWLDHDLRLRFAGRILPFDDLVAERWGELEAAAKKRQVTIPTLDAQLAATALHHGLTLVTRNTSHISLAGVPVLNPWPQL